MTTSRLDPPPFHLVLVQPEIPNNTGAIGRTAMATGCRLHLIHPLGFDLSEKACRRAGLDYWPHLDVVEHASWSAYLESESPARPWLLTTRAERLIWEADFRRGDHLLFGGETRGAPESVHDWARDHPDGDRRLRLPLLDVPEARSLNLANAACATLYEALRRIHASHPDLRDRLR